MPTLLSMGSGAAEGLDKFLERMLLEQKLKGEQENDRGRLAETTRHNTAAEGLEQGRTDALERERQSRDKMMERNYQDQSDRAARDDGRAVAEEIPGGSQLPEGDPAISQITKAGLGGSLLRGLKATSSTPLDTPNAMGGESTISSDPEMGTFQGKEMGPGSRIKLKTAAQSEKAIADKRAEDAAEETGRHNRAMEDKPPNPAFSLLPTDDGVLRVNRNGGAATPVTGADGKPVMPKSPAQVANRRDMAGSVGSHFQNASELLNEADQKGLLGPLAGRTMAEFLAGKVGSTGNADYDELLGALRMELSMIRSGAASLHGRSGANAGIAKEIERKMDEGHMSAAEIRGGLRDLKGWVDKYASKPGGAAPSGDAPADLIFDPGTGTFKRPGA